MPGVDHVVPILKPYKLASLQVEAAQAHACSRSPAAPSAASTSR